MIMVDNKKAITTIMARRRDKKGSTSETLMHPSQMKTEEGETDPRHTAAEDILSALNEKHAGKLTEAMSAFHDFQTMRSEKPAEK